MGAIFKRGPIEEKESPRNRLLPRPLRYPAPGLMVLIICNGPGILPNVPWPGLVTPMNKGLFDDMQQGRNIARRDRLRSDRGSYDPLTGSGLSYVRVHDKRNGRLNLSAIKTLWGAIGPCFIYHHPGYVVLAFYDYAIASYVFPYIVFSYIAIQCYRLPFLLFDFRPVLRS